MPAIKHIEENADYDVLSENPMVVAEYVKMKLYHAGIKNVKIVKYKEIGEIISEHIEIRVGTDAVAFIFKPLACHSYNIIKYEGYDVKIATIDTMLSFYLAFLYANRPYYDKDRILCMATYLFQVQEKNRLAQKGLLRRFSINCIGHQETVEEMRAEKAEKYAELKGQRGKPEYDDWFLRYRPVDKKEEKEKEKEKEKANMEKQSKKTKTNRKRKSKTKKLRGLFF
jgi:hypothetical protein